VIPLASSNNRLLDTVAKETQGILQLGESVKHFKDSTLAVKKFTKQEVITHGQPNQSISLRTDRSVCSALAEFGTRKIVFLLTERYVKKRSYRS
jgi:hypothetical protein